MPKRSTITLFRQLNELRKHYLQSQRNDNSYAGEYQHLKNIMTRLNINCGYVVDIAASDGVTQSCTLGFFQDTNWSGLAVEMDPMKFSKLAFLYANFPGTKLAMGRVIPNNVYFLLKGFEVPTDFTLLNLDIDSYDLHVISQLLKSEFRPKIISMEINEKIPPPIFFTVDYDEAHFWKGDHFFGCSLTAASEIIKPYGYILESLQYNNAIFIRSDICQDLLDDQNVKVAYDSGYRNKQGREKLFPWNSNIDCILGQSTDEAITSLSELFKDYKGKYTLRV